jgi:hypothetical protein
MTKGLQTLEISDWGAEYLATTISLNGYEFQIATLPSTEVPGVIIPYPWVFDDEDFLNGIKELQSYYHAFYEVQEAHCAVLNRDDDYPLDDIDCVSVILRGLAQKLVIIPEGVQMRFRNAISKRMRLFSPNAGFVYLLQAVFPNDHFKIGYSIDPASRIETLGVKLPFPIEPIHLIPTNDVRKAEKQMHQQYANKRVNGEWFKLEKSEVWEICRLNSLIIEVQS